MYGNRNIVHIAYCVVNVQLHYVQQVCIPGLHLSLGIFDRLWTLLEGACKEIDFLCAVDGAGDTSVEGFRKLSSLKNDIETQQKYIDVLTEILTFSLLTGSNMESLWGARLESVESRESTHLVSASIAATRVPIKRCAEASASHNVIH